MATASEEENLTRNAQALYVIPFQALGAGWHEKICPQCVFARTWL